MTNTVEFNGDLKNWTRNIHNLCHLNIYREIFNFWIVFTNNRKYCLFFCFSVSMSELFAIEYNNLNHFPLFNNYLVIIRNWIYHIMLCMYLTNVSNCDLVSKTGTNINTVSYHCCTKMGVPYGSYKQILYYLAELFKEHCFISSEHFSSRCEH